VISCFIGPGIIHPTFFSGVQRHISWSGRQNFKNIPAINVFKEVHGKRECNLQTEINVSLGTLDSDKINSSVLRADFVQLSIFNEIDVSGCGLVKVKVILRLTVSRPVCLGVRHPFGTRDQFFSIFL
jgi:hypothetical protein